MKANDLSKTHIVLADADVRIANVMKQALRGMGFENITIVSKGSEVLDIAQEEGIDLLITEWELESTNGTDLGKLLRDPSYNQNIMMPIMMSTARAEISDVKSARDSGMSEFLVKPFTSQSLFARLKRSIDHPPDFIISEKFTGPDRRRRGNPPPGMKELRVEEPIKVLGVNQSRNNGRAYMVPNDKRIRKQANLTMPLDQLITQEVLVEAQASIDAFKEESASWIGGDVLALENAVQQLRVNGNSKKEVLQLLLSLKSRAGTFGHDNAVKVCFEMYLFMQHVFDRQADVHHKLAARYVDVLKILLSQQAERYDAAMQQALIDELTKMTQRVRLSQW